MEPDFELIIPESMRSDVYAARVTTGEALDYIPFFVRPVNCSRAKIAFLRLQRLVWLTPTST
jgi:N,N-dimethylformamidase